MTLQEFDASQILPTGTAAATDSLGKGDIVQHDPQTHEIMC